MLIYQAVGKNGGYHYKIGAMLLDLKDPTRVLARSRKPILEPLAWYENDGLKSGVVYPCGAAIIKDRLFVYYGGADMLVCVASVKLNGFLEELTANHKEAAARAVVETAPPDTKEATAAVQGYCMKCRKTAVIKNPQQVVLKNKRHAVKGVCQPYFMVRASNRSRHNLPANKTWRSIRPRFRATAAGFSVA